MRIITFSGIDGAGKSTQIKALRRWLTEDGLQVKSLNFWDHVAMFARFREYASRKAFQGDQGIGTPQRPLHRRDKNITAWPVMVLRLFLYLADCISLRVVVSRARRTAADVAIFDRYIYDELANLPMKQRLFRAFCGLALKISPKPDVALVIDADPEAARARKPEYPLEFLRHNRNAYLALSLMAREIIVIEPLTIEAAELRMKEAVLTRLSGPDIELAAPPQEH
jgi:thymidylate kinase